MGKLDFKKTLDSYQARHNQFRLLQLPRMQYLMVDGQGDPNTSEEYAQALQALYPLAYQLKFASKRELSRDYVVPPLEGLWWAEEMEKFTSQRDKSAWEWTLMLMQPEWITRKMFQQARERVGTKAAPAALAKLRLERLEEGLCVQVLHIGPYEQEAPLLERMHREFIPQHQLALSKKHHEIYLSDPRRTPPERLKTILRQPVEPRRAAREIHSREEA